MPADLLATPVTRLELLVEEGHAAVGRAQRVEDLVLPLAVGLDVLVGNEQLDAVTVQRCGYRAHKGCWAAASL
jgi:hypothetical protein